MADSGAAAGKPAAAGLEPGRKKRGGKKRNANALAAFALGKELASEGEALPRKRFFRQRAHSNPLSLDERFEYPLVPDLFDFTQHYPGLDPATHRVTVLDVGCGFGGLTVSLATACKEEVILAMEIRKKVTEFVRLKILALREQNPGEYQNASAIRTNAMTLLPNFISKGQLNKMFFCFPDPHFKTKNHRRRIVSRRLLDVYAYCIKPGGILYNITDVLELHEWMVKHCMEHPAFVSLTKEELDADPCVTIMLVDTEEGKKVARNSGSKYPAAFRRVTNEELMARVSSTPFFSAAPPEK